MTLGAGFKPVELSLLEKLRLLNWPFVLVVALVALVGYGSLYSAGGGAHAPWAGTASASASAWARCWWWR